ncbi:MAG TPA: metal-dependent transcriptional regulator [Thermodesulfobacteriota bacterium]|nr:metal-dependent transcriptional regulator [Thermodesulfobacteriota bacterium]HNU71349.1 metal-dependent transcriptional regulator [Thermodesulfobacteriota bacterium]HQO77742.1 metal-dependent transcriptional regulator [Thermodesulfobacteriota bacterium]
MEPDLTPAMEDYLEQILTLKNANSVVRVRDIAQGMKVKMPSVTSMLNTLAKRGLIRHGKYEYVELTPEGSLRAQESLNKHQILYNFLKNVLQIEPQQADCDACQMEHAVSPVTLKKLVDFIRFIEFCPRAGLEWLEYFKSFCGNGASREKCEAHIHDFLDQFSEKMSMLQETMEGTGKLLEEHPK